MNTGGPAFPVLHQNEITGYIPPETSGMTLRDYFAAKALIAWYCKLEDGVSNHPDSVAIWCYQLADAMLKVREQ